MKLRLSRSMLLGILLPFSRAYGFSPDLAFTKTGELPYTRIFPEKESPFLRSFSMKDDLIVIGSKSFVTNDSIVYLFDVNGTMVTKLNPQGISVGESVSVDKKIVLGAEDRVLVYSLNGQFESEIKCGESELECQNSTSFHFIVATHGNKISIGAKRQNYIYSTNGTLMHTLAFDPGDDENSRIDSVSMSNEIIVTGFNTYHDVIVHSNSDDYSLMASIPGHKWGISIDTYKDKFIIGDQFASEDYYLSGHAYLYHKDGTLIKTFSPGIEDSSYFGMSVALSQNEVIVGADDYSIEGRGAVYVFSILTGELLKRILPESALEQRGGYFGELLAASNDHFVADGAGWGNSSSAYIYSFESIYAPTTPPTPSPTISCDFRKLSVHIKTSSYYSEDISWVLKTSSGEILEKVNNRTYFRPNHLYIQDVCVSSYMCVNFTLYRGGRDYGTYYQVFEDNELVIDGENYKPWSDSSQSYCPDCPTGYICDFINETIVDPLRMYNCRDLQQDVIDNGYGDILAGIYCPKATLEDGGATIKNCPAGHYCEDPFEDPVRCGSGYYCPVKSFVEDLYPCAGCKEGATNFAVNVPMLVAIVFILVVFPTALVMVLLNIWKKKMEEKLRNPKPSLKFLQKIEHILSMMEERLGSSFVKKDDKGYIIGFDSHRLFNAIDEDNNGFITYQELDRAIALSGNQLSVFIQKMNESDGNLDDETIVSRECFEKYFFDTINMAVNFDPTAEDASTIFDSMNNGVSKDYTLLDPENFSGSILSLFLNERQILQLVRQFQNRVAQTENVIPETAVDGDSEEDAGTQPSSSLMSSGTRMASILSTVMVSSRGHGHDYISKEDFVRLYPILLHNVIDPVEEEKRHPFDIQFEDLSLTVDVKGTKKAVVNNVTGRIRSGTMTALMGGSGAGKTSLLNALCGRAYYGETSGVININGNSAKIEDCIDATGFVPQDDIVYAELTVKENFVFAGRLKLPRGTSSQYIKDLANDVIANLGLTRVTNSIVGDVTRRGVSGGEKKRVNIGLELMSKPSILFLDEPTSGLDSSSAIVVMGSLARLVRDQGMTVCTVIHQPRKQIFELFDSLILLGVGGNMVYHGPAMEAKEYFFNLGYKLAQGEALADWMIDISSGELSPEVSDNPDEESEDDNVEEEKNVLVFKGTSTGSTDSNRERLYAAWNEYFHNLDGGKKAIYTKPDPSNLPPARQTPGFFNQVWNQLKRCKILFERNISAKIQETLLIVLGTIAIALMTGPLQLTVEDMDPTIPSEYYVLTSVGKDPGRFESGLPFLFKHATEEAGTILGFGGRVSVIIAVLTTLSTAKVLTDKRVEFFREAASGYNINAYLLAVMIFVCFEVTAKMIYCSLFTYALRGSAASLSNMVVQFILLGWVSSAWGFVFPLVVSRESIVLVSAFFTVFSCVLLSGSPGGVIEYSQIYRESPINALVAGLFAPSRFFIESLAVAEFRAMDVQHGFTNLTLLSDDNNTMSKLLSIGFNTTSTGLLDPFVHEQSADGWDWGVWPSIYVGLGVRVIAFILLQLRNRTQMLKPPLMKEDELSVAKFVLLILSFVACLSLSIYLFLRDYDAYVLCEVDEHFLRRNQSCNEEYNTKYCRFDAGQCDDWWNEYKPPDMMTFIASENYTEFS